MVMIMKRKKINSHLTLEARIFIEEELNKGTSITCIAKKLNRDRSNIGNEILLRRKLIILSSYGNTSCCAHKDVCKKRFYGCDQICSDFELNICDKLKASPHVCNPCLNKKCRKAKFYYNGKDAQFQYLNQLSESRKKLHYTETELNVLNNDFYCLVVISGIKSLFSLL